MPLEILVIPAVVFFVFGFIKGYKKSKNNV
jgi:hypothetical protein